MEENVSLKRYFVYALIFSFIGIIIDGIIKVIFHFGSLGGSVVAISWGVGGIVAYKFIKQNNRVPNKYEKNRLIWLSIIAYYAINILFALPKIINLDFSNTRIKGVMFVMLILAIMIIGQYFVFSWSYGKFANKQLENTNKKREN